jgi:hypothetical protein
MFYGCGMDGLLEAFGEKIVQLAKGNKLHPVI